MEQKDIIRFWAKVNKTNTCWLWTASKDRKGYGKLGFKAIRKTKSAHRVSWEIHYGIIPNDLFVCHKCDVPACVNPEHLFLGTNRDNVDDMIKKNRQTPGIKGVANYFSKLTENQVKEIRFIYSNGNSSYVKLAKQFNINKTTVYNIIKKIKWKHI